MLNIQRAHKRHTEIFAGIQQYVGERGWVSIIDEFAHDTLGRKQTPSQRYDGIVALYPFFGLLLSPMIAAAAMSLSFVSMIANALRLKVVRL